MQIFIQGVLKIVEPNSFKDAATGKTVEYYTNYLQDSEGKLSKLGSSTDLSEFLDTPVVVEADLKADFNKPNLFRVKIISVKKQ